MGAIKQNHQYLLILNAAFSLPEQSQPVNKHTPLCRDASINHLFVFVLFLTMFFFFRLLFLCANRFCVGDKFFLKNNMILCQMDYEEGQLNGSFETQVQ